MSDATSLLLRVDGTAWEQSRGSTLQLLTWPPVRKVGTIPEEVGLITAVWVWSCGMPSPQCRAEVALSATWSPWWWWWCRCCRCCRCHHHCTAPASSCFSASSSQWRRSLTHHLQVWGENAPFWLDQDAVATGDWPQLVVPFWKVLCRLVVAAVWSSSSQAYLERMTAG